MTTVRAKFRCTSENTKKWSTNGDPQRSYDFQAMYDPDVPEDQRYAKATPTGSMSFAVDNPAVTFEPGKSYYLDITPADA
jgi:hypothetical protein